MTPKAKAEELVRAMFKSLHSKIDVNRINEAKQCALIAVEEILSINVSTTTDYGVSWTYWMKVKTEIEKL